MTKLIVKNEHQKVMIRLEYVFKVCPPFLGSNGNTIDMTYVYDRL